MNVAEVAVAVTVTEAGTVSVVLLFVSITLAPPAPAALLSATVQEPEAYCQRVVGAQVRLVSVGGGAGGVALVVALTDEL